MCWFDLVFSDYRKYKKYGSNFFVIVFLTQGFWASFQYRIAHAICIKIKINNIRKIILIPILFWQKIIEISTGISIPWSVKIGHSLYIGHYGTVIINSNAIIGDNCNISQGVTIGISGQGKIVELPLLAIMFIWVQILLLLEKLMSEIMF